MRHTLITMACWAIATAAQGQCGACAVNGTCTVDPPFPAVCPPITPAGVVGVPYELDVTFWVPPSFPEPTTQLAVVLQEVSLQHVERLPLGLTYEASNPSLTYFPQQDPFGCVKICGTPMLAGADTLFLVVRAQGTVGGIPTTQDYALPIPFQVLPASQDSLPDFTFTPDSLCSPMTVGFSEAEGAPGVNTAFSWAFGNGDTYDGPAPPDQTYAQGGTYPVTLQRTFSTPMITQISLTGVSNAWCGDLDEPSLPIVGCLGQPDLYVTVTDARLVMRRTMVMNNVQSTTWNNLSIPLGFPPYTIRVFDKDELSADDLLGTFVVQGSTGNTPFSQSGTAGQLQVQVQSVLTVTHVESVTVFDSPTLSLDISSGLDEVCATPSDLANYAWTLDGVEVTAAGGPCQPAANGLWSVVGSSEQGCSGAATRLVSGVGVRELAGLKAPRLYPNPTSGPLQVVIPAHGPAGLTVMDVSGRVVQRIAAVSPGTGGAYPIDLSRLSEGQYLLRCDADGYSGVSAVSVLRR